MPELPEVEVVRTGLEALIQGRRIQRLRLHRHDLRYPLPSDMAARLTGRTITAVARRSKYLILHLDGPDVLVWHLGMTGQFHVLPEAAPAGPHEHVVFGLDGGLTLRYRDARRFGYAGLMPAADWASQPWFAGLGPEPLGEDFDGDTLYGRCRSRAAPIKAVLMDAAVVVGVGNIYACESLFRAGVDPKLAARRLSRKRASALADAVKAVLSEAIAAGGSTISDFVHADGRPGYFNHAFAVYQRQGEPCPRCGATIQRRVLAGRGTFHCPGCQR